MLARVVEVVVGVGLYIVFVRARLCDALRGARTTVTIGGVDL